MKQRFTKWSAIIGLLGAVGVLACSVTGCDLIRQIGKDISTFFIPPQFTNKDGSQRNSSFGILKSNSEVTENTVHANQTTMSLKFTLPVSAYQAINIYGTGWIFDFELENPNQGYDLVTLANIKTFYIATNMHVIGLIAAATQDAVLSIGSSKLGLSDIASYEGNSKLWFHKTKSNNVSNRQEINLTSIQPGTYSIIPVGIRDLVSQYNASPTVVQQLENNTTAADFAILKITPTQFQKQNIRFFNDFNPNKGIGFANTITQSDIRVQKVGTKEDTMFYSAGYPHITPSNQPDYSYYHQYANYATNISPVSDFGGYRNDNPIRFGHKIGLLSESNRTQIEQRMQDFRYHAYDVATKGYDLGPGASGSPVFDANNNIIGIYWGGYRTIGGVDDTFRGNFTPIFVQSANSYQQDLINNYLAYTTKANTYLDNNFNTNILAKNFSDELLLEYYIHLKMIFEHVINQNPSANLKQPQLWEISANTNNQNVYNNFVSSYYKFISNFVKLTFLNSNHGALPPINEISAIKLYWDPNANIGLKISFVHNKTNIEQQQVNFNTTFTIYNKADEKFAYTLEDINRMIVYQSSVINYKNNPPNPTPNSNESNTN